jgi:hypothetical protein
MLPKAPHGMNLGRLNIGHTFEDRKRAARWLGLDPSVKVAEGRFRGTDWEYWSHWCSSGEPYKTYAAWLETLKRETVAELESIWKGRSAASDKWFEVACKLKIEEALSALVKARIAQARDVEVNRLDRKARAGAWTRVAGTLPGATPNGATEPKADESTCTNAGLTVNGTKGNGTDQRAAIDAFILKLAEAGRKIKRRNIWKVAGYANATEFERFQRGDTRTTQSAAAAFKRVLGMTPEAFIGLLDKKPATK